jgi:DHA1 family multidrug resistance protein-like MFS transporter/DHA1 family quinolone resistance protein-like MFS transporter
VSYVSFAQIAIALLLFIFKDVTSFVPLLFFFLLLGIFYAVTYVESIFHGASGALDRAKRMNYHEVILNVGIIAGGACGGSLYQNFGYPSMMEVTAIILALSVLIQFFVYQWSVTKKRKRENVYVQSER